MRKITQYPYGRIYNIVIWGSGVNIFMKAIAEKVPDHDLPAGKHFHRGHGDPPTESR